MERDTSMDYYTREEARELFRRANSFTDDELLSMDETEFRARVRERSHHTLEIQVYSAAYRNRTLQPSQADTAKRLLRIWRERGLSEDLPEYRYAGFLIGAAEKLPGLRPVVCANLPYNVTTPLLTAFLEAGCFETVTVMIQREVARRICAPAGTPDYGAFGLFVQWHCLTELLFDVPPACFVPQPKVTSSVIRLTRRAEKPVPVKDEQLLFRVIRAAFNQRRKTLVNALAAGIGGLDKETAEDALKECGFDPRIRGEAVDLGGFAAISDCLSGKLFSKM